MASYLDDNDLEGVSEENLRYFYEEYSASIRRQLLHRNLIAPQNVYDVLYPQTKNSLLAKNVPKIINLEENSKTIRDALIAKLVSENISLEKLSEDTRNSLLARNNLIKSADDLLEKSNRYRVGNIAKNVPNNSDVLIDSNQARINNIVKNHDNLSTKQNIDSNSDEFRVNNTSKNVSNGSDLLSDSEDIRKNNTSANVSNTSDLEKDSKEFLRNNISSNKPNESDLQIDSTEFLKNNIAANKPNESDLQIDSEEFLKNNIAANKPNNSDLENDSKEFLQNNISANVPNTSDLETDSKGFLKNNISANKPNSSDLENDSKEFFQNNIAANVPKDSDLENDSKEFFKNNISANVSNTSDLETDSKEFLQNNIAANVPKSSDLENDSKEFLQNNIATNVPKSSDLENDSKEFLQNNIAANKPNSSDLENDSVEFLKYNISANKKNNSDLESDSKDFLQNNISANKPNSSDLEVDSAEFFQNNIAANKPNNSDLENDSKSFFQNNISANKPNNSDLEADSKDFLQNNLASNTPKSSDLLSDSKEYLNNNLASNVPDTSDLLSDSKGYLNSNLASNVPDNSDLLSDSKEYLNINLASNVPDNSDLLSDSKEYLNSNLASNVSTGNNLLADSIPLRNNLISSNVPSNTDLESYSKKFRDNNLAHNPPTNQLGIVVEGIGTSAFLGLSRVLAQGIILRQVLLSKNKPSKYTIDGFMSVASYDLSTPLVEKNNLFSKNKYQYGTSNEYGASSNTDLTNPRLKGPGDVIVRDVIQNQMNQMDIYYRSVSEQLQSKYGMDNAIFGRYPSGKIGGGFYSVNSKNTNGKGGSFIVEDGPKQVGFNVPIKKGSITDAIRNYNLSRNLYNIEKITPGDLESMSILRDNTDEGFQALIASTIRFFGGNQGIGAQLQGNLTPRGIVIANEGAYIKGGSPESLMRPEQITKDSIGQAASMMAQTVPGNPLMDSEFKSGKKGIMHIMDTIKEKQGANYSMRANYDVQNSHRFVIGTKGGADATNPSNFKVARQKFTVANPYKPLNAKKLLFSLQNYSSGEEFYFPPYIQDFSDRYGASWNSINFLGRPEPIFTYNNSTRDGNITFIVLTDYSQNLVIGTDYTKDTLDKVVFEKQPGHFTTKDVNDNAERQGTQGDIPSKEAQKKEISDKIQEKESHKNLLSGGTPESNTTQAEIDDLKKNYASLEKDIQNAFIGSNTKNVYSESGALNLNINNYMITKPGDEGFGKIETKAEDSKKRIDQMIRNLSFQPSFFSGDKVDFVTKMEFLAKMTRPASSDSGSNSGFSFTRPPVCHIHLGDWWNSDIVVDSVDFSYTDAPWTLDDDGRVQPMWATVTMGFKFIGTYRGQSGGPVLSDQKGGFYQIRS